MKKFSISISISIFALALLAACSPVEEVTPKSPFHGIHGIGFDGQGRLLAGSVLGSTLYTVDVDKGTSDVFVPSPIGQADDVAFDDKNNIAWTAFLDGKIYMRDNKGQIKLLAEGYAGFNSLDFAPDGRLYATQVFFGDALYEIDRAGLKKPRLIMKDMGGLNGFEIGKDGKLYGPLWFKGEVVRVDLEKGTMETIASGFKVPAAVNFDPTNGALYVVDSALGQVLRVDVESGKKTLVAQVAPAIDNLAFHKDGRLFISNMADNSIIEINKETGEAKTIISGKLAAAAGLALDEENNLLYVADVFALRTIDTKTSEVQTLARMIGDGIDYPMSVTLTEKHILLTGWSAGAVQILDRKSKQSLALHHGFTTPHDMVELANGDMLVAEFAKGRLVRLSGKDWSKKKNFATGFQGPANLLLSEDKATLYVLENLSGRLSALDMKTKKLSFIAQGLQGAEGLARLPDGRFVLAETKRKRIIAVDKNGVREVLANNLPINGLTHGPIPTILPTGIAVAKDGTIYFSSDKFANVWRIIP